VHTNQCVRLCDGAAEKRSIPFVCTILNSSQAISIT